MSLWLGLRRVSQSFNTLIRHRSLAHCHFTAQSCSRRVLFLAERMGERYLYSAKMEKNGTLGPATMLPPAPSEIFSRIYFSWWTSAVLNGKVFSRLGSQLNIYTPDTGEDYTLPDVPPLAIPERVHYWQWKYYISCYFGFDTLSNEHKVLLVQGLPDESDQFTILKRLFWVFTRSSGSWSQINPFPPEQIFGFPNDLRKVVFANGAIHCICDAENILAFDMVEEQLRKIPLPDDSFGGNLTQSGGHLALIETIFFREDSNLFESQKESDDEKLQLWILEDYNNQRWVKETIHLPFGWMRYNHSLLAFNYNTGEMLLQSRSSTWHVEDSKYFLYYNTKTGIFRRAEVTGLPNWREDEIDRPPQYYWEDGAPPLISFEVVDVNLDDEMERQKSFLKGDEANSALETIMRIL